ncbi:Uncharacterised protein [Mycobacteroides abscessus subsp. massiliense]|nr:Uncharacterised protein [Mycobacteroides abscessus subsp. massiliense]SLI30533.1 Uncharacterised protein [Mycobacteroides abscessus subsp. massiliense]
MTDPAIEVAKKCWTGFADGMFTRNDPEYLALLAAAREMAKSVQELHRPTYVAHRRKKFCVDCCQVWPCRTAVKVYPSEELNK